MPSKFRLPLFCLAALLVGLSDMAAARMAAPRNGLSSYEASIDRSCQTDADCTVKDVHNCCGYYPACVNKDAKTDPALVQQLCAKEGMAGVCGFPAISSCGCVAHACQPAGNGSPMAPVAQ